MLTFAELQAALPYQKQTRSGVSGAGLQLVLIRHL